MELSFQECGSVVFHAMRSFGEAAKTLAGCTVKNTFLEFPDSLALSEDIESLPSDLGYAVKA